GYLAHDHEDNRLVYRPAHVATGAAAPRAREDWDHPRLLRLRSAPVDRPRTSGGPVWDNDRRTPP
ncbi:hypothetical protein, partial [Streptomyces sp. 16-176A]|uniref:hypothetical protein n=1 Tax=Streptomyces sp. 16-176A TaxID=2530458 RepID=UPI00345DDE95